MMHILISHDVTFHHTHYSPFSPECETVFRFKYHGLIKNKRGMQAWTAKLIRNCDVDCTGVVFETGFRKRDPWYDGGSHWYGPY